MSICAFDIGIKNLAYCIMGQGSICAWANVNILATDDEPVTKATCASCKSAARFHVDDRLVCGRHLGDHRPLALDGKPLKSIPTVKVIKTIVDFKGNKRDDAVAALRVAKYALPIERKKQKSAIHESLTTLHDGIRRLIDGQFDTFRECSTFLLENQPVLKNPTMKSVQILLFATIRDCFLGRGLPAPVMRLVHAGKKTASLVNDLDDSNAIIGDKGYATRKAGGEARAIAFCRESAPSWLLTIEGAKKKSDLADALCMCMDFSAG